MVAGVPSCASPGSTTVGAESLPLPVLARLALALNRPAAAIAAGSCVASVNPAAASCVGLTRKLSPTAAVPATIRRRPSKTSGSAALPLPLMATASPVPARVSCQPEPVLRSR